MTTNPSPTTQHFAAGPHQDWPRLSEDAERYLDSPTAGTLPADIPGGRHPILDALEVHPVNGTRATDPVPDDFEVLYLAAGCFWGVERIFWRQKGVWATAVGYMGGGNANPTYREVCTGRTGHAETVAVVYDPSVTGEGGASLIKTFFENHDSTRPNRHGNDVGTQYRSAIWVTTPRQAEVASLLRGAWVTELERAVPGARCYTTIGEAGACFAQSGGPFYLAEDYHQAYLEKNPDGYCNHGPNGVSCPVGILNMPAQVHIEPPR